MESLIPNQAVQEASRRPESEQTSERIAVQSAVADYNATVTSNTEPSAQSILEATPSIPVDSLMSDAPPPTADTGRSTQSHETYSTIEISKDEETEDEHPVTSNRSAETDSTAESATIKPRDEGEPKKKQPKLSRAATPTARSEAIDDSSKNGEDKAKVDHGGAPTRRYLNEHVTPALLDGMKLIAREKPDNPLEVLGQYLIERSKEVKTQSLTTA